MSIKPNDIYNLAILGAAFCGLLFTASLSFASSDSAGKGEWKDKKTFVALAHPPLYDDVDSDISCLTRNIFHESRSETEVEWKAITDVVFNRILSDKYPDEICHIVMADNQFSWTLIKESELIRREQKEIDHYYVIRAQASEWVLQWYMGDYTMSDDTKTATHYHKKDVKPYWRNNYTRVAVIGEHIYYER